MTKILVIEDDLASLEQITAALEPRGFTIQGAANGVVGVRIARSLVPDLILCSTEMSDVDGYAILEHMRDDSMTADIPFIFLSHLSDHEALRQGMNVGADDILSKPFTDKDLADAVNARLHRRASIARKYDTTLNLLRKNIVYVLPHELRTPLQQILGFASLLQDGPEYSSSEVKDFAGRIYDAGNRLHRAVENYLIFAQLELLRAIPDQLQALRNHILANPAEIITRHATKIAETYQRSGDLQLEIENLAIAISKDNFTKIVEELIDNAFKFSESGSGVQIQAGRVDHTYTVLIRDYGQGMGQEAIENLGTQVEFERAMHEEQGLGMGLLIAKQLTEVHQAKLVLESAPNQGTLVTLQFPV